MKKLHTILLGLFMFMMSLSVYAQDAACPKILDSSTTSLYEPTLSSVLCQYDNNGNCIGSFSNIPSLDKHLFYFDTRFRSNGVELIWQTKKAKKNQEFTLLRSRDGKQFQAIGTITEANFDGTQYSFLDNLPVLGNNYYLLQSNDRNGQPLISSEEAVYVNAGIVYLETKGIKKEKENINLSYFIDHSGIFQVLVTDLDGQEQERKNIAMKKGTNQVVLNIPYNGIYFVTLTNGYSSITDIVNQENGTPNTRTAVISDKIILH